ncbi:cytochrome b [Crenalkalicoccus roseus]|uniref:cytochrome b n=1 Tax=Crenalkalicoccus roseus TaxID=1485588 RepID=UPI0013050E09|nr:cytochrome b/b6 domain-containing protein [Crenalkalicoccus roseus]
MAEARIPERTRGPEAATPYNTPAKWFHWVTVALMAVALPVGPLIKFVRDEDKMAFYALHESAGLTLLFVAIARLAWRLRHPPPPLPAHVPRPLRFAANGVHNTLYALLILQPVLGFLMTNAFGFPMRGETAYLGFIHFPKFMEPVEWLAEWLKTAHIIGGWTIAALLVAHLGGVVYHQAIRRDDLLLRMV